MGQKSLGYCLHDHKTVLYDHRINARYKQCCKCGHRMVVTRSPVTQSQPVAVNQEWLSGRSATIMDYAETRLLKLERRKQADEKRRAKLKRLAFQF